MSSQADTERRLFAYNSGSVVTIDADLSARTFNF